jgi:7-cyano-7-deazaguanine synthase
MAKAVVLLSGGLDSATNLFWAHREHDVLLALTADYGQRAASREIAVSRALCSRLSVRHHVVDLRFLGELGCSSLTDRSIEVPVGDQVAIDDPLASRATAARVWVPNRNGVLLNVAAAFAEARGATVVIPGFNLEEASTFPDNSHAFMSALDASFRFSTANGVTVECPTVRLDKIQIVALARELAVPFASLWPCYFADEKICGHCESCQRFLRALRENHIEI